MGGIAKILGIDEDDSKPLLEAREAWPRWVELDSGLGVVPDLLDLRSWTHGRGEGADPVFRSLARLGSPTGGDVALASTVLCWVLLPGAIKLAREYQSSAGSQIDMLVATELWTAARSVDWRHASSIACAVLRRTRRGVQVELGVGEGGRRSRRGFTVVPKPPEAREFNQSTPGDREVDASSELRDLLESAALDGWLTEDELRLLFELAIAAEHVEASTGVSLICRGRAGLTSREVKDRVADVLGYSPRTIARQASHCLDKLARYAAGDSNKGLVA